MDLNSYTLERLVAARLGELRAASARAALFTSLRPKGHGARAALGKMLIGAGRWLLRGDAAAGREAGADRAIG